MSDIVSWAKSELDRIPNSFDDKMQKLINDTIIEIIQKVSDQEYTDQVVDYMINLLTRLLKWKPISVLTGEEDEWGPFLYGSRQNKRYYSVFQREDGTVVDLDGVIVSDDGGFSWFTSSKFDKKISFPYIPPISPEKIYIEKFEDGTYEVITEDQERIDRSYKKAKENYEIWKKEELK